MAWRHRSRDEKILIRVIAFLAFALTCFIITVIVMDVTYKKKIHDLEDEIDRLQRENCTTTTATITATSTTAATTTPATTTAATTPTTTPPDKTDTTKPADTTTSPTTQPTTASPTTTATTPTTTITKHHIG